VQRQLRKSGGSATTSGSRVNGLNVRLYQMEFRPADGVNALTLLTA
jgi:hypothetical protein